MGRPWPSPPGPRCLRPCLPSAAARRPAPATTPRRCGRASPAPWPSSRASLARWRPWASAAWPRRGCSWSAARAGLGRPSCPGSTPTARGRRPASLAGATPRSAFAARACTPATSAGWPGSSGCATSWAWTWKAAHGCRWPITWPTASPAGWLPITPWQPEPRPFISTGAPGTRNGCAPGTSIPGCFPRRCPATPLPAAWRPASPASRPGRPWWLPATTTSALPWPPVPRGRVW